MVGYGQNKGTLHIKLSNKAGFIELFINKILAGLQGCS